MRSELLARLKRLETQISPSRTVALFATVIEGNEPDWAAAERDHVARTGRTIHPGDQIVRFQTTYERVPPEILRT